MTARWIGACLGRQRQFHLPARPELSRTLAKEPANVVLADPQMIAFGFNVRIGNLVVEEMAIVRQTVDSRRIVIQEASEEME